MQKIVLYTPGIICYNKNINLAFKIRSGVNLTEHKRLMMEE